MTLRGPTVLKEPDNGSESEVENKGNSCVIQVTLFSGSHSRNEEERELGRYHGGENVTSRENLEFRTLR